MARRFSILFVLSICLLWFGAARPVAQQGGGGVLEGFVSTQSGTIRLGGAEVVLHNAANQQVASVLSDGDGHYRFTALQQGKYHDHRVARGIRDRARGGDRRR